MKITKRTVLEGYWADETMCSYDNLTFRSIDKSVEVEAESLLPEHKKQAGRWTFVITFEPAEGT